MFDFTELKHTRPHEDKVNPELYVGRLAYLQHIVRNQYSIAHYILILIVENY